MSKETTPMTLREAQRVCLTYDSIARMLRVKNKIAWRDVYESESAIIEDLKTVFVPESRVAPVNTFSGYQYIYSFAEQVQSGKTLSQKQMAQCKRLAIEIKKAAEIAAYVF